MSIQIITDNHHEVLHDIFGAATNEIRIMSPYIKEQTATLLCDLIKNNPEIKCTIITRFVQADFIDSVSSLEALKWLVECGALIYALRGLHAKLYLVNDDIALLGSANFTTGGFYNNHEASFYLKGELPLVPELNTYFNSMLAKISKQKEGPVTIDVIEKELAEILTVSKNQKPKSGVGVRSHPKQRGATIPKQPRCTDILTEPSAQQAWLKFEGVSTDREDPEAEYAPLHRAEWPDIITCFPGTKKPSGIKVDDPIYIGVVTWDALGRETIVIAARCNSFGFEKDNMATPEMIENMPWMERFPAYLKLRNVEYLTTAQKNGISLLDLLEHLGPSLYPSTIGTNTPNSKMRNRHGQHSHMKITATAARYIDSEFERLAREYGTNLRPLGKPEEPLLIPQGP